MKSVVKRFRLGHRFYEHVIFMDDDRIELRDQDNNIILTFDASCNVFDRNKVAIGKTRIHSDHHWEYTDNHGMTLVGSEDLLNLEVAIAKNYLVSNALITKFADQS